MASTLAASLQEKFLAPTRRSAAFGQELSEREVVVLRLLATGLSQREIAAQLYVSHNTIKTQVRTAYRKLGAGTRAQAVRRAGDLGVLGAAAPSTGALTRMNIDTGDARPQDG